ncbi:unnamed protein product [Amaranthus hypochondriacus]
MAVQINPSFPDYSEMIMAAIEGLNDENGSSEEAITGYIESNYPDLPPTYTTHVSYTLEKLKQTGQVVMINEGYYGLNPDGSDEPNNGNGPVVKRGRGRPPKPKVPLPSGVVPSPARPRGRPPKPRDPLAPTTRPVKTPSSGRPRGRPRKYPIVDGGSATVVAAPPPPSDGVKRGRGRPKKNI